MAFDFKTWIGQPTTINGIGKIAAVGVFALAQYLAHDITASAGLALLVHGIVGITMKDNTAAQKSVEKLVADATTAIVNKHASDMIPQLTANVLATMQAFQMPPVAAVVTAPTEPRVTVYGGPVAQVPLAVPLSQPGAPQA